MTQKQANIQNHKKLSAIKRVKSPKVCLIFISMMALLLAFGMFSRPHIANAQSGHAASQNHYNYSNAEQIGFAFYKLGGAIPPFDQWIKHSDHLEKIAASDRDYFIEAERKRLQQGFANFDPAQDLIEVRANMIAQAPAMDPVDGKLYLKLRLADIDGPYLPYFLGGEWIAAVPSHFERFNNIAINADEFEHVRSGLKLEASQEKLIPVYITLRANRADMSAPLKLPKTHAWLLGVDIISLELWSEDKERYLWGYHQEGFMPDEQRELLELYKR